MAQQGNRARRSERPPPRKRKPAAPPPPPESSDDVSGSSSDEGSDASSYIAHTPERDNGQEDEAPLVALHLLHWGKWLGYLGVRFLASRRLQPFAGYAPYIRLFRWDSNRTLQS